MSSSVAAGSATCSLIRYKAPRLARASDSLSCQAVGSSPGRGEAPAGDEPLGPPGATGTTSEVSLKILVRSSGPGTRSTGNCDPATTRPSTRNCNSVLATCNWSPSETVDRLIGVPLSSVPLALSRSSNSKLAACHWIAAWKRDASSSAIRIAFSELRPIPTRWRPIWNRVPRPSPSTINRLAVDTVPVSPVGLPAISAGDTRCSTRS